MKIRVLSDLHREGGPFTWTDQGEDIVVLAGDIDNGIAGIEWAKTIPKPVVMVAGNHDHWGCEDFHEGQTAMRKAAKGSNVHFLERDAAIITVGEESVRFLGCTLWTDYCGGSRNMVYAAADSIRDYRLIKAPGWNARNKRRIAAFNKKFGCKPYEGEEDLLSPTMLMDINQRSVKWLDAVLQDFYYDPIPTVIVTHHAPSMQSLIRSHLVSERDIEMHDRIRPRGEEAYRIAAYANNLDWLLKRHGEKLAAWIHGHTHVPLDYSLHGVRIVCNPRGYHERPLSLESAMDMRLLGYMPSPDTIKRDQEAFSESPERGSTFGFERNKIIDFNDGIVPCLVPHTREVAQKFLPLIDELREIAGKANIIDLGMLKIMVRAVGSVVDEINAVLQEIMDEKSRSKTQEWPTIRLPQSIISYRLREAFDSAFNRNESQEFPSTSLPDYLSSSIEQAETMHQYFAGEGYEQYVREMWNDTSKDWLRRKANEKKKQTC